MKTYSDFLNKIKFLEFFFKLKVSHKEIMQEKKLINIIYPRCTMFISFVPLDSLVILSFLRLLEVEKYFLDKMRKVFKFALLISNEVVDCHAGRHDDLEIILKGQ